MKSATKVILLFKDGADDGFAYSIANALQPNPNSNLRRLEESFELPLDKYGIKDRKASGNIVHFLNMNNSKQALVSQIQKPPQSLQIYHEQFACLLHLVRVLDIPAFVLVGQHTPSSHNNSKEDLEVIYEIGEHLAKYSSLSFLRERIVWNPPKSSRASEEPWRALYG